MLDSKKGIQINITIWLTKKEVDIECIELAEVYGHLISSWNIFNQVLDELTDVGKDQFVGINETIPTHYGHVSNTVTLLEKL